MPDARAISWTLNQASSTPGTLCPVPASLLHDIASGNFVVEDTLPRPTAVGAPGRSG